jgi:hypothetical protein
MAKAPKPLLVVAVAVAVGALVRKRSSAKADAALWHEATSGSSAGTANSTSTSAR